MDIELLTAALGALPELGALSGMAFLVILLLRQIGTHEDQKTAQEARHAAQIERMSREYDTDVTQLREENTRLREQRDDADARVRESLGLGRGGGTVPIRAPSPRHQLL